MLEKNEVSPAQGQVADSDEPAGQATDRSRRRTYLLPLLLLVVLAVLLASRLGSRRNDVSDRGSGGFPQSETGESIELVIDYGDGAQRRYPEIPWRAEMTVGAALDMISTHRHGVSYQKQGTGERAFLHQIEDAANQGAGEEAEYWLYYVNGERAQDSFAVHRLQPGDRVLWKFTSGDYNKASGR